MLKPTNRLILTGLQNAWSKLARGEGNTSSREGFETKRDSRSDREHKELSVWRTEGSIGILIGRSYID
jgi:hypothetical protein